MKPRPIKFGCGHTVNISLICGPLSKCPDCIDREAKARGERAGKAAAQQLLTTAAAEYRAQYGHDWKG